MTTPPFRRLRVHGIVSIVLVLTLGGALVAAATPASSGAPTSNNASASSQPAAAKQAAVSVSPSDSASPKPRKPEVAEDEEDEAAAAAGESSGADHALARLTAAGIPTSAAAFARVADQVGVGGAVRVFAFAEASGKTPDEIVAMFKGGLGWGRIATTLDLSIGPGIGWIMGQGHGAGGAKSKDKTNGKAKDKGNGATKP